MMTYMLTCSHFDMQTADTVSGYSDLLTHRHVDMQTCTQVDM